MFREAALGIALVLGASRPAYSGTTGVLHGYVLDSRTHIALADVAVEAKSKEALEHTKTDARGYFIFINLPPGEYYVSFLARGYYPTLFGRGLTVEADSRVSLKLELNRIVRYPFDGHALVALVRPGVTADVYELRTYLMPSAFWPNNNWMLSTVPGVQIAPPVRALP